MTYRLKFPHQFTPDDVSEIVEARDAVEALRLLRPLADPTGALMLNLQAFENGRWVWVR